MNIVEVNGPQVWNNFILGQKPNTFLQSWQWGQVQVRDGDGIHYLGTFDHGEQVAAALVVTVHARRGNFYLIPHGPIIKTGVNDEEVIKALVAHLKQVAGNDKSVCIRIAPLIETTPDSTHLFKTLGFKPAPMHVHAELTWVLDISVSEEHILGGMRKTTRHAVKKGEPIIRVDIETSTQGLDRFWPLYEATRSRHQFVPFSYECIRAQVEEFGKTGEVFMPIASYEGKDVAAAIMFQFGDTVFYYHGASQKLPSTIPAAHVLHWESIKEAKRRGATKYNFWGIAPDNQPNHPFAGITVFKKGFGGKAIDYMHAQDLPLSLGYWKLWIVETIRKIKRGF